MCCNNLPIENPNRHLLIYSNSPSQRPNNSPGWVDTTMECKDACLAHPNCSAWVMFGNCNTGPNRTRTKHSCSMITDAAASWVDDGSVAMATICSVLASSDLPSPLSRQHRRKVNIGTNAGLFWGGAHSLVPDAPLWTCTLVQYTDVYHHLQLPPHLHNALLPSYRSPLTE